MRRRKRKNKRDNGKISEEEGSRHSCMSRGVDRVYVICGEEATIKYNEDIQITEYNDTIQQQEGIKWNTKL